jgi:CheY-like chemotaxis protein
MKAQETPKARVLVVDDEKVIHESVRRVLEDEGYSVEGVYRVDQALDRLKSEPFDLVLTDLMMPEKNGMELVHTLEKDFPDVGAVVFTGYATVDSVVESMKSGAIGYLKKPFSPDELIQVADKSLGKTLRARHERNVERGYLEAEKALSSSLDLQELLRLICSNVVGILDVNGASVLLYRKKDQSLQNVCFCGLSEDYVKKGILDSSKSIPEVFRSQKPVLVTQNDFDLCLHFPQEARKENLASILSLPLKLEEEIMGFLRIYSNEKVSYEDWEMKILDKFASHASRSLENAIQYERLRSDIEGMKKLLDSPGTPK